jgi:hypothetical protein
VTYLLMVVKVKMPSVMSCHLVQLCHSFQNSATYVLIMEVAGFYQTSVDTTQCHSSEYFNFSIILKVINTSMKIHVFWDVTVCCLTSSSSHFEGTKIFCNDRNCKYNDTMSHPRNWIFNRILVHEKSVVLLLVFSSLHSVWSTVWYV